MVNATNSCIERRLKKEQLLFTENSHENFTTSMHAVLGTYVAALKDSSEARGNFYLSRIKLATVAFPCKEEIRVESDVEFCLEAFPRLGLQSSLNSLLLKKKREEKAMLFYELDTTKNQV